MMNIMAVYKCSKKCSMYSHHSAEAIIIKLLHCRTYIVEKLARLLGNKYKFVQKIQFKVHTSDNQSLTLTSFQL